MDKNPLCPACKKVRRYTSFGPKDPRCIHCIRLELRRKHQLFGTSNSKEYREWYRKTRAAHSQLPTHEQNWPTFFAKAKAVEMRRQGVNPPNCGNPYTRTPSVNSPSNSQVRIKPHNVVPLNPVLSLPPDFDGPLRFDFSIQP
jgi:hypothetical protein